MLNFQLLQNLSDLFGPPGFEYDIVDFIREKLKDYPHTTDRANNLIFKNIIDKNLPTVLVDAHTDECGFVINNITNNGYLQVMPLGGLYAKNSLGHSIQFRANNGNIIKGIVSTVPVHIEQYQNPPKDIKFNNLFIDIGAVSREEVEKDMGLAIGDPGVFDTKSFQQHNSIFGKGLDDRVGCFCLINLIEYFFNRSNNNYNICFSFSVQEEFGLVGIKKVLNEIKPDLIIAAEGTTGSDLPNLPDNLIPTYPGKGPCITIVDHASILSRHMRQKIDKLETEADWHYKRPIFGVTNIAAIQRLGFDAYGLTVSVPCRSIHSAISSARKQDIINAYKFIKDLLETKDLFK